MMIAGQVVVVTGGASGIGRALCERFAAEGAKAVAVADVNPGRAAAVAEGIVAAGGVALAVDVDVTDQEQVDALVERTEESFGPIDLFCSNAGIAISGGYEVADDAWDRIWDVNVMGHVRAARAVLPGMRQRRRGYLLNTASAAGLLTNPGAAPYTVTKHAAVAWAEWLAITYGDEGIIVSCLCPQGVRTPLLMEGLGDEHGPGGDPAARAVVASGRLLEPAEVAEAVIAGLADERFLILPHPEVAEYVRRKAADPDRWLAGMRRLQARVRGFGRDD